MKILVIGASGMLAKPVITDLNNRGHQLRLFSRNVQPSMFLNDYEIMNGDVFNPEDLEKTMKGCNAIHVNLSLADEASAMKNIVSVAQKSNINLISTISGCSVCEENRWFKMIDNKFRAEQILIQSGIDYLIFRATWFFESLELMIRDGKATIIGQQNNPGHWIAANDYARMVSAAYEKPDSRNRVFYVMGRKPYLMKDLLKQYCEIQHPDIKKINTVSTGMLKFIATISRNKKLKEVAEMFGYFEKTKETGNAEETYSILHQPEISFEKWIYQKN